MTEVLLRAAGAALCASFAAVLLRRSAPELTIPLSAAAVVIVLFAPFSLLRGLKDLGDTLRTEYGVEQVYVLPLLKCLAISLITKFTAELCRDASQSAVASAVEFTGTACALGVVLPLVTAVLKTIGGLL